MRDPNSAVVLSILLAGCDVGLLESEATSMVEEALVQVQARQAEGDISAPAQARLPPPAADPLAFLQELEAFLEAQAGCAAIQRTDEVLSVDFGEAGCAYLGRSWTGAFTAVVTQTDAGTAMDLTLVDLSDGSVTMNGTALAVLGDDERAFVSDLHLSPGTEDTSRPPCPEEDREGMEAMEEGGRPPGPPPEADVAASRAESPLDGDFANGVVVTGERVVATEEGEVRMQEQSLEIRAGERVPQAGTITIDGPRGAGTISFARTAAGAVLITADGPDGSASFEVDPATGARL